MAFDHTKFPAPWFGGKTHAAPLVWAALGDVDHFVEPFCGSCAVLLNRPHEANRAYFSETVNDSDGLLVNALRSMQLHPDATAEAASRMVCEADLTAIHLALVRWKGGRDLEKLMADPEYCDPKIGGWWLWGVSCWIGSGWCSGDGPWHVNAEGRIEKQGKAPREPGVSKKRPHLGDDGRGVNHAGLREPGVSKQLPHLANDGQGVNAPQLREPGVGKQLPHLANNGRGVNHAGLREPGVSKQLPHLANDGQGVNAPQLREPGVEAESEYHPLVMPKLSAWMGFLSARLRHVRILNGDWTRAVTGGASLTLPCRLGGDGVCGVFLDPPYTAEAGRDMRLYVNDSGTVGHAVADWAIKTGPDRRYRIVVAGFEGEYGTMFADAGWREVEWFAKGFLRGGMAQTGKDAGENGVKHQQGRERLWCSPTCINQDLGLFGEI